MKINSLDEFHADLVDTKIPVDNRMHIESDEARQLIPLLNLGAIKSKAPFTDAFIQGSSDFDDRNIAKLERLLSATLSDISIDDLVDLRDLIRVALVDEARSLFVAHANRAGYEVVESDFDAEIDEWNADYDTMRAAGVRKAG